VVVPKAAMSAGVTERSFCGSQSAPGLETVRCRELEFRNGAAPERHGGAETAVTQASNLSYATSKVQADAPAPLCCLPQEKIEGKAIEQITFFDRASDLRHSFPQCWAGLSATSAIGAKRTFRVVYEIAGANGVAAQV